MKIPENTVTQEDMFKWYELKLLLAKTKSAEMLLRKKIFEFFFPEPVEGTNTAQLENDFLLKGGFAYDRQIDEAAWAAISKKLVKAGVKTPDVLVHWKPSLVKSEYDKLTEAQRHIMDQALVIKESSPSLEIVKAAKKAVVGEVAEVEEKLKRTRKK